MRNKLHEEGFAQVLANLSTEEGVAGLSEQGIALNDAMRNAASYLAVILRGMAPNYPDSPSLSWLERKIENAAKGEDDALLDALFTPVKLRGRPSLARETRQRIAGYAAVQHEVFCRPLTTGDYNEDSALVATASRYKQSVSTVRRCAKEFFPNGITCDLYQEMTQDQANAFWRGFDDAKCDGEESFLIAYHWLASAMTDQQRVAAIEYSLREYGQDLFTRFAEAGSGYGFDENDIRNAKTWERQKYKELLLPIISMKSALLATSETTETHPTSIFYSFEPLWKNDKQRIISTIIDLAISCSNSQIDLNIFEENNTP